MATILVLAGTTEATELAGALTGIGHRVISSLAGLTRAPQARQGEVRVGGFGGSIGLADYLRAASVDAVIDATHPFADQMPWNCLAACGTSGVPSVRLLRPGWVDVPGDQWIRVPNLEAAARWLAANDPVPVFLAVGKQSVAAFHLLPNRLVFRSIEPINELTPNSVNITERGPFTVAGELALFTTHQIGVLVTKDSGGNDTLAKLVVARQQHIPVVLVERPPQPPVTIVDSVAAALRWLAQVVA